MKDKSAKGEKGNPAAINKAEDRKDIERAEAATDHPGCLPPTVSEMSDKVGNENLIGAINSSDAVKARQHLLNPKKYRKEIKRPNPGKMPNNRDPYPVDLKIEELEVHYPPIKINKVTTPNEGKEATVAAMSVGDHTEKRIVKLENMMATLMRYLFRLGARVPINCQYYGGQSPNFEKYAGIRCLADDRVEDGKLVQIDQCLNCTRYEPVYGQAYELLNNLGANVAAILDDNQAGYSTMKEYVDLTRAESMIEPKRKARIDLSTVQTRSPADAQKDLDLRWGNGIKMDWHYVPKEEQKCHINWRQSINDDGAGIQRLSSFPMNESNAGYNMTKNGNGVGTSMQQNRDAIESSNVPEISYAKDEGKRMEGSRDDCINRCAGTELNRVRKAVGSMNTIDPLTVACIAYIEGSSDYAGIASKLQGIASKLGVSNTAIIVAAYGTGIEVFMGKGNDASGKGGNPPRIDISLVRSEVGGDNPSESSEDPADDPKFSLKWESANSWLWADFGKRFTHRAAMCGYSAAQCSLLPKVCYLYVAVAPFCKSSRFDSDKYSFPFDDTQIAQGTIYYVSPFGNRSDHFHRGIDLAAPRGTLIHAVHDGTVTEANDGNWSDWAAINIDHSDGTYSRYLHCNSMSVRTGEKVKKGQVIGTVGGYGPDGPDTYGDHLHLEICEGDAETTKSYMDPLSYFPLFQFPVSDETPITVA